MSLLLGVITTMATINESLGKDYTHMIWASCMMVTYGFDHM
jgi:hypothetical protein